MKKSLTSTQDISSACMRAFESGDVDIAIEPQIGQLLLSQSA
jgi:hypothetical protein